MSKHWSRYDRRNTIAIFGGAIGAAGWIFGVALELFCAPAPPAGIDLDIAVVCLCAVVVLTTGGLIWSLYLFGRRLSVLLIIETLLGISLVLGTFALVWIDRRGLLPVVVRGYSGTSQPGNEVWEAAGQNVPPELAYAAPVLILILMALAWWPPVRRLLKISEHIQRGTRDEEYSAD